uniref:C2H2-type domain-containing protein n=1 Tax=Parastrongyloides trichosuri TaxID=131310 RepID=A0A0N4ZA00_PARTI
MLQCILCNSEYRNIKDMCEHILEERSKMTNLYKHLGRPIEIISGSNGGPSSINAPIDLQLEGRFKRFETSIDSIKQNQKNRYQQKVMLSAHPIVTRSPSTTVSSPFRDGRTSVEGGCSDSASRCSTSTGGGNGSSKGNINNDEGKKFCIFDNCCKKCHKVVEYLCINMKLKQPLCKDCLDVSTHQKNNISNIENIPFNHDNNIKNKDKTSEENILPEDILIKVEGSQE